MCYPKPFAETWVRELGVCTDSKKFQSACTEAVLLIPLLCRDRGTSPATLSVCSWTHERMLVDTQDQVQLSWQQAALLENRVVSSVWHWARFVAQPQLQVPKKFAINNYTIDNIVNNYIWSSITTVVWCPTLQTSNAYFQDTWLLTPGFLQYTHLSLNKL
jgi:hypothetical protein